jgi:hypothetical protein
MRFFSQRHWSLVEQACGCPIGVAERSMALDLRGVLGVLSILIIFNSPSAWARCSVWPLDEDISQSESRLR